MLSLRPFRKNDAKTIITWTNKKEEFYKWSAGILGEYPVTENACLKQHQAEKITTGIFRLLLLMKVGLSAFLLQEYALKMMIKNCVSVMLLSILQKEERDMENR